MNSFEELWLLVAEVIQGKVSDIVYKVWLADLSPVSFDGSTVMLAVNADFKRKVIEQKFTGVLHDAFEQVLGFPVEIVLELSDGIRKSEDAADAEKNAPAPAAKPDAIPGVVRGTAGLGRNGNGG